MMCTETVFEMAIRMLGLLVVFTSLLNFSHGVAATATTTATVHRLLFATRTDISIMELIRPRPSDAATSSLEQQQHLHAAVAEQQQQQQSKSLNVTSPTSASDSSSLPTAATASGSSQPQTRLLVTGLDEASAVDFLWSESSIYWTDVSRGRLYHAYISNTSSKATAVGAAGSRAVEAGAGAIEIVSVGLVSPDGLACDWVGRKLYWADSETDCLEVAELDGRFRKVLYWRDVDQPRSVALHPQSGYIYWADWGESPKLERAGMDGDDSSRQVLVSGADNEWPNGLTIDNDEMRLYWTDIRLGTIQSCRLDGSDRRKLIGGDPLQSFQPASMTIIDDTVYWTDWQALTIYATTKYREYDDLHRNEGLSDEQQQRSSSGAGADVRVVAAHVRPSMDIKSYEARRQPYSRNACGKDNGGCSHLCLLSPAEPSYRCACPTGVRLAADNKTCADGPEEMLLLARRTDLRRISLDTPDFTDVVLNINGVRHAVAIDFDPVDHMVYWTDDETRAVRRSRLDGSGVEFVINTELDHPDGIAVDWIGRNLYWTDKGMDRIEMSRLNGTSRHTIVSDGLTEPRAIVLDPFNGRMYWTDWGKPAKIESAALDGTDRNVVVSTAIGWPNGLAIDRGEQRLYWADAETDRIETILVDGTGRHILVSDNVPHIFGFALLGDYLYWTDWHRRTVERVHKYSGKQRSIIVDQLPDVMGLAAVNTSLAIGSNGCSDNNGGCSHLCIFKPTGVASNVRCLCPRDMKLHSDGRNCITPQAYLVYARQIDIRRISLGDHIGPDDEVVLEDHGIKAACAIDCHVAQEKICYTDTTTKTINCGSIDGGESKRVVEFSLSQPEGIAVDWIANNLYWTDFGAGRIEMSRLDGTSRLVIVWQNVKPRAIAVDPSAGWIYWSNVISSGAGPRLERAGLDGSGQQTIVTSVGQVSSITIDYDQHRLYWISADCLCIESSDMVGGSRQRIVSGLQQPYGIALFGDYIYWSDLHNRSIVRAQKWNGTGLSMVRTRLEFPMNLAIFHASRQKSWNSCAVNNGGCAHLCIAHPTSSVLYDVVSHHCACPTHYTLASDNQTCLAPSAFILVSQHSTITRLPINDVMSGVDVTLPLPSRSLRSVRAIAYDIETNYVYWVESRTKMIRGARSDGSETLVLVPSVPRTDVDVNPHDIALVSNGGGRNSMLYWSDAAHNVIRVVRLNGQDMGTVISISSHRPRAIAVEPVQGLLFWTNAVRNGASTIECSFLDGSSPRTLYSNGIKSLGPIAVDAVSRRIYWFNREKRSIESGSYENPDDETRTIAVRQVADAVSLSVVGSYVYWLNGDVKSIERVSKSAAGGARQIVRSRLNQLTDIIVVQASRTSASVSSSSKCSRTSKCSHFCTVLDNDTVRCSCPVGMQLAHNELNCVPNAQLPGGRSAQCRSDQFQCHIGGELSCLPVTKRCDGVVNCDEYFDELRCSSTCSQRPEFFQCHTNDQCIVKTSQCDGKADCADGSDESVELCDCIKSDSSIQCNIGGWCLLRSQLCDGREDCPDAQDEANCTTTYMAHAPSSYTSEHANKTLIIIMTTFVVSIFAVGLTAVLCWRYCGWCSDKSKSSGGSSWISSTASSKSHEQASSSGLMTKSLVPSLQGSGSPSVRRGSRGLGHPLFYDRVVGTSSSSSIGASQTAGGGGGGGATSAERYPCETLNPPPSPITTDYSASAPSMSRRQRGRRRDIWQTRSPMSPCSTDNVDSESSWPDDGELGRMISTTEFGYETDPLNPPPPTPSSRYRSADMDSTVIGRLHQPAPATDVTGDPMLCCCLSTPVTEHKCRTGSNSRSLQQQQQQDMTHSMSLASFTSR